MSETNENLRLSKETRETSDSPATAGNSDTTPHPPEETAPQNDLHIIQKSDTLSTENLSEESINRSKINECHHQSEDDVPKDTSAGVKTDPSDGAKKEASPAPHDDIKKNEVCAVKNDENHEVTDDASKAPAFRIPENSRLNDAKTDDEPADGLSKSHEQTPSHEQTSDSGLKRMPAPLKIVSGLTGTDARTISRPGIGRESASSKFNRVPSKAPSSAGNSAQRASVMPKPSPQFTRLSTPKTDVKDPASKSPAAGDITAQTASDTPEPDAAKSDKPRDGKKIVFPTLSAPADHKDDVAPGDDAKRPVSSDDNAKLKPPTPSDDDSKPDDFDIADLPTHMLDVISDEDLERYDENQSKAKAENPERKSPPNIKLNASNFAQDCDDIHETNSDNELNSIHAPNIPSIPVLPPSEFERTIIFERSENRWDDADNYHLPEPGDTVGNYRVLSMLGKGGFGAVYSAQNLTLGREEALKLILPSAKSECGDIDRRFQREVDIVSRLEHPNIVRLYSSGLLDHNVLWMTMELIRGMRLDKRIEKGVLSFARAKNFMLQILSGLMEAHRRQIVHRDLKPANIMIEHKEGYDEHLVILDFGLSKALGAAEDTSVQELTLVDSRRIYGTPQYMAPEQLNMGILGPWTDVYAAGLIFFELLVGTPAVTGDSLFEVAYKQSYEPIQFPDTMRGTALEAVISRACDKNPARRYTHAGEFFNALQHIQTPNDDPIVLATHLRQSDISNGIMHTQIPGNPQDERTNIAIQAMALPRSSAKQKAEFRKKAHFVLNIIAYPLAIAAIGLIAMLFMGFIRFSN